MSEKEPSQQDRTERLMELQSRLRELTEARKAKWRRLGQPLPETVSPDALRPTPPATGVDAEPAEANVSASDAMSAIAPAGVSLKSADAPGQSEAPETIEATPAAGAASSAHTSRPAITGPAADRHAAAASAQPRSTMSGSFARRRGLQAKAAGDALHTYAGEVRRIAAHAKRFAVSRVRDLSGGLGTRRGRRKRRPGDPITPEELIDDRSLAAKLLGAGVFFIALVTLGAIALVQLGKLEIPWLDESSLPAATSSSSERAAADGRRQRTEGAAAEGTDRSAAGDNDSGPSVMGARAAYLPREGEEGSSTGLLDGNGSAGDMPGVEAAADSEGALSPEVLEFTRLQGDLAFRMGEYEIVRAEFEEEGSGCGKLTAHYASVDSSHLALSRVVARWREVPYRQIKAYEELSASLDEILRHYAASGCGLDPSQLP